MGQAYKSGCPINATSSQIVSKASGSLLGFYINNTNLGTVVLRGGILSTSTAFSGTITPAIGWHKFPAYCPNGLYATIGGVALDVTFIFAAG